MNDLECPGLLLYELWKYCLLRKMLPFLLMTHDSTLCSCSNHSVHIALFLFYFIILFCIEPCLCWAPTPKYHQHKVTDRAHSDLQLKEFIYITANNVVSSTVSPIYLQIPQ